LVQRRATTTRSWDIDWKPERLSSFHGRDLFAPVAAILARGEPPPGRPREDEHASPDRLAGQSCAAGVSRSPVMALPLKIY